MLNMGGGVEQFLAIDRIASCNALFLMMGGLCYRQKKEPLYG